MPARHLTIRLACKRLAINEAYLMRLVKAKLVPYVVDAQGLYKFRREDIQNLPRNLLLDKSDVIPTKLRPKKIISIIPRQKGKIMDEYTRNAKEALNLSSGLSGKNNWILGKLIDLMAVHDNKGIPCEPSTYVAALLGCGHREWNSVVAPALVSAHKIKRIKQNGIDVWVWHDKNLMVGPRAIIKEPVQSNVHTSEIKIDWGNIDLDPDHIKEMTERAVHFMDMYFNRIITNEFMPDDTVETAPHGFGAAKSYRSGIERLEETEGFKAAYINENPLIKALEVQGRIVDAPVPDGAVKDADNDESAEKNHEIKGNSPKIAIVDEVAVIEGIDENGENVTEELNEPPQDPIPFPSALDLLGRAGVNVVDHPHGEFFWARADHKPTVEAWVAALGSVDAVLMALHDAVKSGAINPNEHPNRLSFWDHIVIGVKP